MSDIHEATGAYALNALDAGELDEFEAHLATCPDCQHEVADFGEVAAELALLSLATPPPSLRDDVLAAIGERSQQPGVDARPAAPAPMPRVAPSGTPRRALPGSELPDDPDPPQVDELALRRQRRRLRVLSGLVAAMLAMAVGLGGVVYSLVQERQAQVATQTLSDELQRAPDAQLVQAQVQSGGRVTFLVSKQLNRAQFIGTDLPDPGDGNRYQLWTGTGNPTVAEEITGVSRDAQVLESGPVRKAFFTGDVAGADFLAVNVERLGAAVEEPSNPVLAAGTI